MHIVQTDGLDNWFSTFWVPLNLSLKLKLFCTNVFQHRILFNWFRNTCEPLIFNKTTIFDKWNDPKDTTLNHWTIWNFNRKTNIDFVCIIIVIRGQKKNKKTHLIDIDVIQWLLLCLVWKCSRSFLFNLKWLHAFDFISKSKHDEWNYWVKITNGNLRVKKTAAAPTSLVNK